MVEDYKQYIKDISNETGFIQSTLEKNVYALDSIVAEYQNIMGNKDIIKDEKILNRIKNHPMINWKLKNNY